MDVSRHFQHHHFAECTVTFNDGSDPEEVVIALGSMESLGIPEGGEIDSGVFFYCDGGEADLKRLMEDGNGEDFRVVSVNYLA